MIVITQVPVELRMYSIGELADLYEIGYRALKKKFKPFLCELGEKQGRYYSIEQVTLIFSKLGVPGGRVVFDPMAQENTVPLHTHYSDMQQQYLKAA